MECFLIDASTTRYLGNGGQLRLLREWAPVLLPPKILAQVRNSRAPAVAHVEAAIKDGLLQECAAPSVPTYQRVQKRGGRALGAADSQLVAAAVDLDGGLFADDSRLIMLASQHGIDSLDLVQLLQVLVEHGVVEPGEGLSGVIAKLEDPGGKTFKAVDKARLLRLR